MTDGQQEVQHGKTPWMLWWSLVAGFAAWGTDLALSYMLEQHSCSTGHHYVLHVISALCFAIAISGVFAGFLSMRTLPENVSEEGGKPFDRAHFQALLGMAFSFSFAIVVIAGSVPRWILSPCD
jgi:hypothetical protein